MYHNVCRHCSRALSHHGEFKGLRKGPGALEGLRNGRSPCCGPWALVKEFGLTYLMGLLSGIYRGLGSGVLRK